MKKDFSTIRIKTYTKDQMDDIKRFLRISKKKMFISDDTALLWLIELAKRVKNIETKMEVTESDLRSNEKMIKNNMKERDRIDTDLTPYTKVQLKRVIDVLYQLGITKKKFTYADLAIHLLNTYVEKYPEMKQYLLQDQYMKQKIAINKLVNRKMGMDIKDDDEEE
jgi:hypothetical protein